MKNGNELDKQVSYNYYDHLVNKFYKILCMREDKCDTLDTYIESLTIELSGNKSFQKNIDYDGELLTLISILLYFLENINEDEKIFKREFFKCISIIKKLKNAYM